MKERTIKTAKSFGILEKVKKLEKELLEIDGVTDVEFDLDGFYDDLHQVIFLTKYDISVADENCFQKRKELIDAVLVVIKNNGLNKTEDTVEDYGEHFYFVTSYGKAWA